MDRGENYLGGELLLTENALLELLKKKLCPDYVRDRDSIVLAAPWDEEDFRVGVYLYDIQDYSDVATYEVPVNEEERRFPPKAVELSCMIFCNERHRFGGVRRDQVHTVLNEIVRLVYDHPVLARGDGETFQVFFLKESMDFKLRLWGGFDMPLQPAVYVKAVPVLVSSLRIRRAGRVKEQVLDVGETKRG